MYLCYGCDSQFFFFFFFAFWQIFEHFCCIEHTFPQVLSFRLAGLEWGSIECSEWLVLVFACADLFVCKDLQIFSSLDRIIANNGKLIENIFCCEWIIENWQFKIFNKQKVASVVRMDHLDSFGCCRGIHTSVVFAHSDTRTQLQPLCWHLDTQPVTWLSQSGLQLEELEMEAFNSDTPLELTQDWHTRLRCLKSPFAEDVYSLIGFYSSILFKMVTCDWWMGDG